MVKTSRISACQRIKAERFQNPTASKPAPYSIRNAETASDFRRSASGSPGVQCNGGRSGQRGNSEQGSGKAAIEEGGVDPVVEPERLNQQTAEAQRESSDGK